MTKLFYLLSFICSIGAKELLIQERLESLVPCWSDTDCQENSFCFNNDINKKGNCKCLDNYVIWRNRKEYECHLPADYSQSCARDVQCRITYDLALCKDGVCACEDGAHYIEGNCYKTSGFNQTCQNDYNCRAIDTKNIYCSDGYCRCKRLHHLSKTGFCISTAHLGDECKENEQCIAMNAQCHNGMCQCLVGYVQANDLRSCLKAATYFEAPCEQLSQCNTYLTGAKCLNGKCICPTDHHFIGTECIKSVRVGDICNSDKECQISREYVDKIVCVNNICKCTKDSYDISNVCVQNEETGGQKLIKPFDIFFLITLTVLFLIIFV